MNSSVHNDSAKEYRKGEFLISTDRARLDLGVIHRFLTNCYWAKGVPVEIVSRSIENSLCFGIYLGREQIGFARVVSDFATYAYIGDVFVLEPYRGRGFSKWMMECILEHPSLQSLRRWSLVTADAHGLYAKFGFVPIAAPERYMEIVRQDIYEKKPRDSRALGESISNEKLCHLPSTFRSRP